MAVRLRGDLSALVLDAILVASAYSLMLVLVLEGDVPADAWTDFRAFLPLAVMVTLAVGMVIGIYSHLWRHASLYEAQRLAVAGAMSTAIISPLTFLTRNVPLSTALTGGIVAMLFMGLLRFQSRLSAFRRGGDAGGAGVIVIGACDDSEHLVRQMLGNPGMGFVPVAALDDNPANHNKSFMGVRVLGRIDDLADVARLTGATMAIFAETEAQRPLLPRIASAAERAQVTLKILPDFGAAIRGGSPFRDIRDVNIEDLLGRQQIQTDLLAVSAMLRGQRVLITGAGGSIGSEIVRQVAQCDPAALILVDHDETHLFDIATEFPVPPTQVLIDIRNRSRVAEVFATHRPDVVFHAAAHKHVPILEDYPCEAGETNVLGTANVLDAAVAHGVQHFVAISTDKAVYPSSVMGASKRMSEHLVVQRAPGSGAYCAVRFGNVVGSRGSVVPTFMRQIRAGGPVTVTDERMTRFFMSIPEAVQLVLQAATLSDHQENGQIFMLDMGEPVRILDLAERMIRLSGNRPGEDIEIQITGRRPGEKYEEELITVDEDEHPTNHASIRRVSTTALDSELLTQGLADIAECVKQGDHSRCRDVLRRLALTQPAVADVAHLADVCETASRRTSGRLAATQGAA